MGRGPGIWLACAALAVAACGGGDPIPAADIGLPGVPTEPGSLAGRFALFVRVATEISVFPLGTDDAGDDQWYLVTRTWDDDEETYTRTIELCGGRIVGSFGAENSMPQSTYDALPDPLWKTFEVFHEDGVYVVGEHLEQWGLDLPDPWGTQLPKDSDAAGMSPHLERIVDMDGDGHPGVTVRVDGIASGDLYEVRRRNLSFDGVVRGPDRIVGLVTIAEQQLTIDATSSLINRDADATPHPNPLLSWFEQSRLTDTAGCPEVRQAIADGELGTLRPF